MSLQYFTGDSSLEGHLLLHGRPSSAVADTTKTRLAELTNRFRNFERQVANDTRARKITEEATLDAVLACVGRIEAGMALEAEQRERSLQKLQASLDKMLTSAQRRLEASFLQPFDQLSSMIDALNERTSNVEQEFWSARERYVREMDEESGQLTLQLAELTRLFAVETASRKDRDEGLQRNLQDFIRGNEEKLARDQRLLERKFEQLQRDADESVNARDAVERRFQARVQAELEAARAALADTTKARIAADDDIVAALNHYTQELTKAVSSVSQSTVAAVERV